MGGKRALIWAAVSSEEQAGDEKASLDGQVEQASAAAEKAGYTVVGKLLVPGASRDYYDPELAKREVPQYAELEAAVENRTADVVVYRSTDRLPRGEGVLHWLFGLFRDHDAIPWSLDDGPLPVDPDPLLQGIKAWRAKAEITERRGPTGNLLPGLIIAGSTGGAKQCVPRRGGETGCKNDSPSSVGSRRRENERRKKTKFRDHPHNTSFCVQVLDARPSTSLRFPAKTRRLSYDYPTSGQRLTCEVVRCAQGRVARRDRSQTAPGPLPFDRAESKDRVGLRVCAGRRSMVYSRLISSVGMERREETSR